MLNTSLDHGFEASVTASVDTGAFGNYGASVGGSYNSSSEDSTEHEAAKEISSAAESNQSLVYETDCKPPAGQRRAGLWQWVISTQDYTVAAFTPHTVCRTGDLAFRAPECPFWSCANFDCSECKQPSAPTTSEPTT